MVDSSQNPTPCEDICQKWSNSKHFIRQRKAEIIYYQRPKKKMVKEVPQKGVCYQIKIWVFKM